MTLTSIPRWLRLSLAISGSLGLVLLAEWFLFVRFRGPAWEVVPLSAALVGWAAARAGGRWSGALVLSLLFAAPLVALVGEWSRYAAEVRRALTPTDAQVLAVERAQATQAVAAFLKRQKAGEPGPQGEEAIGGTPHNPPLGVEASPGPRRLGLWTIARLYWESMGSRIGSLLLGVSIAVPISFQAARMTISRRART